MFTEVTLVITLYAFFTVIMFTEASVTLVLVVLLVQVYFPSGHLPAQS